jgi:hypothetical protein
VFLAEGLAGGFVGVIIGKRVGGQPRRTKGGGSLMFVGFIVLSFEENVFVGFPTLI